MVFRVNPRPGPNRFIAGSDQVQLLVPPFTEVADEIRCGPLDGRFAAGILERIVRRDDGFFLVLEGPKAFEHHRLNQDQMMEMLVNGPESFTAPVVQVRFRDIPDEIFKNSGIEFKGFDFRVFHAASFRAR
jgi:hypothetical protein